MKDKRKPIERPRHFYSMTNDANGDRIRFTKSNRWRAKNKMGRATRRAQRVRRG